jgi:hypothetical protein
VQTFAGDSAKRSVTGHEIYCSWDMENLIETLNNAVAFLFAARIFILIALVVVVARFVFGFFHSSDPKKYQDPQKRGFIRHRDFLKHGR